MFQLSIGRTFIGNGKMTAIRFPRFYSKAFLRLLADSLIARRKAHNG